jgi:hypothetical protein
VLIDHVDPIFFFPLVTDLHALIGLSIPCIPLGLGFMVADLLSPTVMSYRTGPPSYMMLIYGLWFRVESLVFHLS